MLIHIKNGEINKTNGTFYTSMSWWSSGVHFIHCTLKTNDDK